MSRMTRRSISGYARNHSPSVRKSSSVSLRSNWTTPRPVSAGRSISSVSGSETWRKSDVGRGSPVMTGRSTLVDRVAIAPIGVHGRRRFDPVRGQRSLAEDGASAERNEPDMGVADGLSTAISSIASEEGGESPTQSRTAPMNRVRPPLLSAGVDTEHASTPEPAVGHRDGPELPGPQVRCGLRDQRVCRHRSCRRLEYRVPRAGGLIGSCRKPGGPRPAVHPRRDPDVRRDRRFEVHGARGLAHLDRRHGRRGRR